MKQLVKRYWAMPKLERVGLPVAFGLLGVAVVVIKTVPFKHVARLIGRHMIQEPWVPVLTRQEQRRAHRLGSLVSRAARWTPWRSNCYPQSLVTAVLLRIWRIPYSVFFGVAANPEKANGIDAHAWVFSGRRAIIGGYSFDRYRVLACWAWVAGDGPSGYGDASKGSGRQ